ncbi:MAG TPA: hypothetical protein VNU01_12555 [Egibacteraceae bacterium]|nr:hypothetical protein [Egibacteraceae bacterium]
MDSSTPTTAGLERIAPVEPPYDAEVDAELGRWMPPGSPFEPLQVFRVLARNLPLMQRMLPLGSGLLNHPSVSHRDRELIIQRTCALAGAEAEWATHVFAFGKAVGITREQTASLVFGGPADACWTDERDRLVIELCDQLHATATVTPDLRGRLAREFDDGQVVELLVIAGWYRTFSYVVNGAGVTPEEFVPRFTDFPLP